MIYTIDLPSTDPVVNSRLGYALPTSILLTPYLATNAYFVEYTDAIDEVYDALVWSKIRAFAQIRNMWVSNSEVEALVEAEQMIPFSAWTMPERELLIKQVNLLGMKIGNSGVLDDNAYLAISRFLGQYWLEKGRYTCIDFLNFCLGSKLSVHKLWTEDYEYFYAEGDAAIGTPVWEGGTWYPTTHTAVTAKGGLDLDPNLLTTFFYDISNYNLVLSSIDENFDYQVVTEAGGTTAPIVAAALLAQNSIAISNYSPFGADPPDINVFDWVTTRFYSNVGTNVQWYLGQPSGWMLYDGDKKIPVYGKDYQTLQYSSTMPTKCYGTGEILLGAKMILLTPPGSPNSKSRIAAYIPERYYGSVDSWISEFVTEYYGYIKEVEGGRTVTVDNTPPELDVIEFVSGVHPRQYLGVSPIPLTTPRGFVEISTNILVPYW